MRIRREIRLRRGLLGLWLPQLLPHCIFKPLLQIRRVVQPDDPRVTLHRAYLVRPRLGKELSRLRPAKRRQKHPIAEAKRTCRRSRRQRKRERLVPLFEYRRKPRCAVAHDEHFFRPRHRNIQYAKLLGNCLPPHFFANREPRQRRKIRARVHIDDVCPREKRLIKQDTHRSVAQIKALGEVRQKHDRKFQSLGLVHAHDMHRVFCAASRPGRRRVPRFCQIVHVPKKAHQALIASGGKAYDLRAQKLQIFFSHRAVFHRGKDILHTGRLQNKVKELRKRQKPCTAAHVLQPR